jgi:hypothetical protein
MRARAILPLLLLPLVAVMALSAPRANAVSSVVTVSPKSLVFNAGGSTAKYAVVTNTGTGPLDLVLSTSGPFKPLTPTKTIPPHTPTLVGVLLNDDHPAGDFTGKLVLSNSLDIVEGSVKLQFRSTHPLPGGILLSQTMVDFGKVEVGKEAKVVLALLNNEDYDISPAAKAPAHFTAKILGDASVDPTGVAGLQITFKPDMPNKKFTGTVTITSGSQQLGKVQVTGFGTPGSTGGGGTDLSGDWDLERVPPGDNPVSYKFTFTRDASDHTLYTAIYSISNVTETLRGHFDGTTYAGTYGITRTLNGGGVTNGDGYVSVELQPYHQGDSKDYMVGKFTPDPVSGTNAVVEGDCQFSRPHR